MQTDFLSNKVATTTPPAPTATTAERVQALLDAITGRKVGKITIKSYPIRGRKVAFASGNSITIDSRFAEWSIDHEDEFKAIVLHEIAHIFAERENKKKKRVWHGEAWKAICRELGGDGERYYTGSFVKPENKDKVFLSREEMKAIKPTQPADTWERGTFNQWLMRGYHVIKGQHGSLAVWEFKGEAFETEDGKESNGYGKAAAVYFTPDQVEANV